MKQNWFSSFHAQMVSSFCFTHQHAKSLQLCPTQWPHELYVACQAPLSMGFSRQEYWSGLPFSSPRNLPDPGIKPMSHVPALTGGFFNSSAIWKAPHTAVVVLNGAGRSGAWREEILLLSLCWGCWYHTIIEPCLNTAPVAQRAIHTHSIKTTTRWAKLFTEGKKILGWLISSFGLFCKMVQKTRRTFLVNPVLPQTFKLGTHQPRLYPGYDDSSFPWVQHYLLKPQVHFCSLFFPSQVSRSTWIWNYMRWKSMVFWELNSFHHPCR